MIEINKIIHGDCMDYMPLIPELNRDILAIVDPPYGIGASRATGTYARIATNYTSATDKKWDVAIPDKEYFRNLFKYSTNQIIFGGNYMTKFLPSSQGWICWYKTDELKGRDFSEFELAFTSFKRAARHIEMRPFIKNGCRVHPTQKPIALYRWILQNYAKKGQLILDTHSGSGSCAIACYLEGYDFIAIEKDIDYYNSSVARFEEIKSQGRLFK